MLGTLQAPANVWDTCLAAGARAPSGSTGLWTPPYFYAVIPDVEIFGVPFWRLFDSDQQAMRYQGPSWYDSELDRRGAHGGDQETINKDAGVAAHQRARKQALRRMLSTQAFAELRIPHKAPQYSLLMCAAEVVDT